MLVWDAVVAGSVEEVHARFDANCQRCISATTPSVRTARCRSDITLRSSPRASLMLASAPHARGEQVTLYCPSMSPFASAPHARGRRLVRHLERDHLRFSPARAGNTQCCTLADLPTALQPRTRGEHEPTFAGAAAAYASAPHARGTRDGKRPNIVVERFSPARAGNTISAHGPRAARSLQPRTRGEHVLARVAASHDIASAPHARGTRDLIPLP